MYEQKITLDNGSILINNIDDAAASVAMNKADTPQKIKEVMEKYASILKFKTLNAFVTYSVSEDKTELKNIIDLQLSKTECKSVSQWQSAFINIVVLNAIYKSNYTNVLNVLKTNNDVLGVDMDLYNSLNDNKKITALKNFSGILYKSTAEVKTAFEITVNSAKTSSGNGSGSNGGGGGSGSAGSGGNARVNYTPSETNTAIGFEDLDSVSWAKDKIEFLHSKGILSGRNQKEFAPDDYVAREEFLTMLLSVFPIADGKNIEFSDVPKTAWYYPYVSKGAASGIIYGETDNIFGVGKNITREQMAVMVYRMLKYIGITLKNADISFTDQDSISEYAYESVCVLGDAKIINGYTDGTFKPQNNATRAEAAVIIAKIYETYGNK